MSKLPVSRQGGIALPVMMILLVVMLIGSLYLMRSSTMTALTAANLAYDSALSRAADRGLLVATDWLSAQAKLDRTELNKDHLDSAYNATLVPTQSVNDPAFWTGSKKVVDAANNTVEYVIHRMCSVAAAYDDPANRCTATSANTSTLNNTVAIGDSIASDAQALAGVPQLHYVVTARILGPRGGNVINQAVVMIGA